MVELMSPAVKTEEVGSVAPSGVAVEHVTKRFGDVAAVDDVSFSVNRGEFCSVLGASGAGKSSVLRVLAGLERPDAGRVLISGREVSGPNRHIPPQKRNVGVLFQSYALWPHMTVREQVAFPLVNARTSGAEIRERVREICDMVGVSELLGRYPSEMSGGQQQRVALARAVVMRPQILLLDEPFSNLDVALRRSVRRDMKALQRELQITTVMVTHDQEEAMSLADTLIVLSGGKVAEFDKPRVVYESAQSLFGAVFVGSANTLTGEVASVEGGRASVRLADGSIVRGRAVGDIRAGETATLCVKPDDVSVGEATAKKADNVLRCSVLSELYFGAVWELSLRSSAGGMVARTVHAIGEGTSEVTIHFDETAAAIYPGTLDSATAATVG
jgi:ABC-type Fe3+/spermidine/putrescine transport system ATPase subunit